MKDTMKPLRKGVWDTLDGSVVYNGDVVKGYDEKVYTGDRPNLYYILSNQQESPGPGESDCGTAVNSSINIEIISRTPSEVSKDAMDDVSDIIYELLEPSYQTPGFSLGNGLQILTISRESAATQSATISDTQSILRKIIKFNSVITQIN